MSYDNKFKKRTSSAAATTNHRTTITDRKYHDSQLQKISERIKELDEKIKSLHFVVPDKETFAKEKSDIIQELNDTKSERESHFTEKRSIDAELKILNDEITAKFDAIGKLKSKLRYKTAEKVDEVIIKLEKQLPRMKMKPPEQRRIEQEISDLRQSKDKVVEFGKLQKEVNILKDKQKELRGKKQENIKHITSVKQKESATKALLESHKKVVNETWDLYKSTLSQRDSFKNEKDELQKQKHELVVTYQREHRAANLKGDIIKRHEPDEKVKERGSGYKAKSVIQRKKPLDEKISSCDVLLAYIDKQTSQHALVTEEQVKLMQASSESLGVADTVDGKSSGAEDIYRGIKRRPSKRERRKRQHTSELSKRIDLHVVVLEKFVSLGIVPPSTVADLKAAAAKIRNKKISLKEEQAEIMKQSEPRRAKSIPSLANKPDHSPIDDDGLKKRDEDEKEDFSTRDDSNDSLLNNKKKSMSLQLGWRHKSCPSLVSDAVDKHYMDLESPASSNATTRGFGSGTSDDELESPVGVMSAPSFVDRLEPMLRTGSVEDEKPAQQLISFVAGGEKLDAVIRFHEKGSHKVHFASDVVQRDEQVVGSDYENATENFTENSSSAAENNLGSSRRDEASEGVAVGELVNDIVDGHNSNQIKDSMNSEGDAGRNKCLETKNINEADHEIQESLNEKLEEKSEMFMDSSEQKSSVVCGRDEKASDGIEKLNRITSDELIFDLEVKSIDCVDEQIEDDSNRLRLDSKDNALNRLGDKYSSCEQSGEDTDSELDIGPGSINPKDNGDAFLQFPIDDVCDAKSVEEEMLSPNANNKHHSMQGIRIPGAFPIVSVGSCSPRKTSNELVDQNNTDGVFVET
eukprot:gene11986-13224_t